MNKTLRSLCLTAIIMGSAGLLIKEGYITTVDKVVIFFMAVSSILYYTPKEED